MKKIITISREFGSGGRSIGKKVAEKLGFSFYDSELIDMAAEASGLSKEFITRTEQSISSGLLYTLLLGTSYASPGTAGLSTTTRTAMNVPLADQVFNAQRQVVIDLAKKGPCVIVGRCSDYILTHTDEIDGNDVFNVFIYAPLEFKAKRAVELKGLSEGNAKKDVKLIDKRRANHYNTFTEQTWGDRKYYHALLNSSLFGIEGTADIVVNLVQHT
ncbi:MAG: cytidylate kinase-like family protein [Treponema sp.]|nr:cytidylate kinase-like family protein [Treponema sp.]